MEIVRLGGFIVLGAKHVLESREGISAASLWHLRKHQSSCVVILADWDARMTVQGGAAIASIGGGSIQRIEGRWVDCLGSLFGQVRLTAWCV
jgi:hypothetical protein